MRFSNDVIYEASNITANDTGEVVDIRHLFGYSMQTEWTSTTAAANIRVQGSNDQQVWVDIAPDLGVVASNNGTTLINSASEQYYGWIRISVAYTSGTITSVKVTMGAKGV